jgi:hypothetical protein
MFITLGHLGNPNVKISDGLLGFGEKIKTKIVGAEVLSARKVGDGEDGLARVYLKIQPNGPIYHIIITDDDDVKIKMEDYNALLAAGKNLQQIIQQVINENEIFRPLQNGGYRRKRSGRSGRSASRKSGRKSRKSKRRSSRKNRS